ncbi:MAG: PQQ-binding-like beta-propeller repeat protein [Sedimentisphaerales bacterium]|nr:PQQ-binding-like beta-propeller repeat protein [Sedimentisphaerales bacterium]
MRTLSRREGLLFLAGCLVGLGTAVAEAQDASSCFIAKDLLDHAGLALVWQNALPVKSNEKLDVMQLVDERLYVLSSRNYAWSLDRNNGKVIFSQSIAPEGFPILGWAAYADRILCVIDNRLVELDTYSGLERRVSDLGLSIVAPPIRNGEFFYISAADRRLHAFRARDLVQLFQAAAKNDSLVTTILADDELVVFGTDAGNLLAITANGPRKLWEFKAAEGIAGSVVRDGNSFIFASKDMSVYKVDMMDFSTVDLAWKYRAEGILDRSPLVTKDIVYQYAPARGLTAIRKQSGQAAWSLREGVDLLAEAASRAFIITKDKTLTAMDNTSGRKLYWVNFSPVVNHAANVTDAKIYVADAKGHIACLAPAR